MKINLIFSSNIIKRNLKMCKFFTYFILILSNNSNAKITINKKIQINKKNFYKI